MVKFRMVKLVPVIIFAAAKITIFFIAPPNVRFKNPVNIRLLRALTTKPNLRLCRRSLQPHKTSYY